MAEAQSHRHDLERDLQREANDGDHEEREQRDTEHSPPATPDQLPGSAHRVDRADGLEYDGGDRHRQPDEHEDHEQEGADAAEDAEDDGADRGLRDQQDYQNGPE